MYYISFQLFNYRNTVDVWKVAEISLTDCFEKIDTYLDWKEPLFIRGKLRVFQHKNSSINTSEYFKDNYV